MKLKKNVGVSYWCSQKKGLFFNPGLSKIKSGYKGTFLYLLVLISSFTSSSVFAQDPGKGGTQAGFEIDAEFFPNNIPSWWIGSGLSQNYFPNTTTFGVDWSGAGAVLKQQNSHSIPGTGIRSLWQVDGNWGNKSLVPEVLSFAGSSNKNGDAIGTGQSPYSLSVGGSGPQKNDITNTFLHSRVVNDSLWLFFAAETRSTNGASYLDFEYNQAGVKNLNGKLVGQGTVNGRTVGDFLLVINYTGGGNRPIVGVRKWLATGTWSAELSVGTLGAFVTTNTAEIDAVAPNMAFAGNGAYANKTAALQLVEGGINITALNLNLNLCAPEATVTVKTRSSPSYTSELKDLDILNFPLLPSPSAPQLHVVNPDCHISDITITVTSPVGTQYEYSNNGGAWQSSPVFLHIAPGTGYSIMARAGDCLSSATECPDTNGSALTLRRPAAQSIQSAISLGEADEQLKITPNAFAGKTSMEFKAVKTGQAIIKIYNVDGGLIKEVFNQQVQANETYKVNVDATGMSEGIYFGRLIMGDAEIQSTKFIIQK